MRDVDTVFKPTGFVSEGSFADVERFNQRQGIEAHNIVETLVDQHGVGRDKIKIDYIERNGYRVALVYALGGRYHYNPQKNCVHCSPEG